MPSQTRRWFTGLAASMALWPAGAEAQATAGSFEELGGLVKAEETVVVTDMNGRRVRGALSAVGKDSLSLVIDGRTQSFARSEVSTVRLADGLGNGALIGAGVGAGAALGILAIVGSGDGYVLSSAKVGAPLLLSGIGALVGVLVDRAHEGGRVVYVSPRRGGRANRRQSRDRRRHKIANRSRPRNRRRHLKEVLVDSVRFPACVGRAPGARSVTFIGPKRASDEALDV